MYNTEPILDVNAFGRAFPLKGSEVSGAEHKHGRLDFAEDRLELKDGGAGDPMELKRSRTWQISQIQIRALGPM